MEKLLKTEKGATAPEYALMVALVATVIFGAVQMLGNSLVVLFNNAAGMFGS